MNSLDKIREEFHERIPSLDGSPTEIIYPSDEVCKEITRLREDYERACQMVAEMHAAAVGEITGPKRGVVEDVTDVRTEVLRLRALVASHAAPTVLAFTQEDAETCESAIQDVWVSCQEFCVGNCECDELAKRLESLAARIRVHIVAAPETHNV